MSCSTGSGSLPRIYGGLEAVVKGSGQGVPGRRNTQRKGSSQEHTGLSRPRSVRSSAENAENQAIVLLTAVSLSTSVSTSGGH